MGNPVAHFEIVGADPAALREYYGTLFGWEFSVGGAVHEEVSAADQYGFVEAESAGINGGVCGGAGYASRVLFYVGVDSVEAALAEAERLGGTRRFGPLVSAEGDFAVGQFADPAGNIVGVAGGA
jgi:uncharacterized protein